MSPLSQVCGSLVAPSLQPSRAPATAPLVSASPAYNITTMLKHIYQITTYGGLSNSNILKQHYTLSNSNFMYVFT